MQNEMQTKWCGRHMHAPGGAVRPRPHLGHEEGDIDGQKEVNRN